MSVNAIDIAWRLKLIYWCCWWITVFGSTSTVCNDNDPWNVSENEYLERINNNNNNRKHPSSKIGGIIVKTNYHINNKWIYIPFLFFEYRWVWCNWEVRTKKMIVKWRTQSSKWSTEVALGSLHQFTKRKILFTFTVFECLCRHPFVI